MHEIEQSENIYNHFVTIVFWWFRYRFRSISTTLNIQSLKVSNSIFFIALKYVTDFHMGTETRKNERFPKNVLTCLECNIPNGTFFSWFFFLCFSFFDASIWLMIYSWKLFLSLFCGFNIICILWYAKQKYQLLWNMSLLWICLCTAPSLCVCMWHQIRVKWMKMKKFHLMHRANKFTWCFCSYLDKCLPFIRFVCLFFAEKMMCYTFQNIWVWKIITAPEIIWQHFDKMRVFFEICVAPTTKSWWRWNQAFYQRRTYNIQNVERAKL